MKRTIFIASIFILTMILAACLAGCLGNSESTDAGHEPSGAASQQTPWPTVTTNVLTPGEKMPRLETLPPELL